MLDLQAGELVRQYSELFEQVCSYRPDMADRPNMVVLNKRDLMNDDSVEQVCATSTVSPKLRLVHRPW